RNRPRRLGDGVHWRRKHRHVHANAGRQARRDVHLRRHHAAKARRDENVVKSETGRNEFFREFWFHAPLSGMRQHRSSGWAVRLTAEGLTVRPSTLDSQHRMVARFFPTRPAFSMFSIYSEATGTWHAVSPMSTATVPIVLAACFACFNSGLIYAPTEITN